MHNFDITLAISGNNATVTLFRGQTVKFTKSGSAFQLSSNERRPYQLATAGSGYQFLSPVSNLIYTFDSTGALTKVEDRNGNALTVTQAPGGVGPATIIDGLGRTLTFTYTGTNLTSVKDHSGRSVGFEYASGNLATFIDALGKRTTFAYATAGGIGGLMTAMTRPLGNKPFTQTYDAQGRVATQTDALSNTMNISYAANGNGATITEPGGVSITDTHDANRNLTSESDPSGASSQYAYDSNNRPVTVTDRLGNKTTATWDAASGLPATYTDQAGNKTTFRYAATTQGSFTFYDLIGVSYPDGTSVSFTRDGKGNPTSFTDQAGFTLQATYNSRGQILTFNNPPPVNPPGTAAAEASEAKAPRDDGNVTVTFTYNPNATLGSIQLATGDTTQIAYNAVDDITKITNPDGTLRLYQIDGRDRIVRATDELGNATSYGFDDNGNLTTITDPLNDVTTRGYDGLDRLVTIKNPLGKTAQRTFDATNRMSKDSDSAGNNIIFNYNAVNVLTSLVDPNGKSTAFGSDKEARVTRITNPLAALTSFSRDPRGFVNLFTDANNQKTSYFYDALGRQMKTTDPLNQNSQVIFDPRSLPTQFIFPGGITESFKLNELGSINQFTDPNGNTTDFVFDGVGRRIKRTDPLNRVTRYGYDSLGRENQETRADQSVETFVYDLAGNLINKSYSDGTKRGYTFDADRRITHADNVDLSYDAAGNLITSNGLQNTFGDNGLLASTTLAPGRVVLYTYDPLNQLGKVTDWTGASVSFGYDVAGQMTSKTFSNGINESHNLDPVGNRTVTNVFKASSSGTTPLFISKYVYDGLNRPTQVTLPAVNVPDPPPGYSPYAWDSGNQEFGAKYDPLGQVLVDPANPNIVYVWNAAGNLISRGADVYTYDGLDGLISTTSGGVTQNFVLNYGLTIPQPEVVRVGGVDKQYNIFAPNGTLLFSVDGATNAHTFFHFDAFGSTGALSDDGGNITDTYGYTRYGETVFHRGPTVNIPFTFNGQFGLMQQQSDPMSYYDPQTNRWYNANTANYIGPAQDAISQGVPGGQVLVPEFPFLGTPTLRPGPGGLTIPQDFRYLELLYRRGYTKGCAEIADPQRRFCPGRTLPTTFAAPAPQGSLQVPRFIADPDAARNIFAVNICRTNLLYPFVTNQAGFDTELAIANTNTDPFAAACPNDFDPITGTYLFNRSSLTSSPFTTGTGDPLVTTPLTGLIQGVAPAPFAAILGSPEYFANPSPFSAGIEREITKNAAFEARYAGAGNLAILRQLHPDWSVQELKALALSAIEATTKTPPPFFPRGTRAEPGR
jgi:YD repeat-containing protein